MRFYYLIIYFIALTSILLFKNSLKLLEYPITKASVHPFILYTMIEGLLKHCTDMKIEENYVDTYGQSEFAFSC